MFERNKQEEVAEDVRQTSVLEPELVFGLVGPLGSNIDATQEALMSELKKLDTVRF